MSLHPRAGGSYSAASGSVCFTHGCDNLAGTNRCSSLPYMRLEAQEPLPNEQIIQIAGTVNGQPFTCPGDICDLPWRQRV